MFFCKKRGPFVLVGAVIMVAYCFASASALESYQEDLKRLLAEAKRKPEGRTLKRGKSMKGAKKMMMIPPPPSLTPDPTPAPTPSADPGFTSGPTFLSSKLVEKRDDIDIFKPSTVLYKEILTCTDKSQPTFCQAFSSSITCERLTKLMNECTSLSPDGDLATQTTFTVYDPNNCGDGLGPPIAGCLSTNSLGEGKCRVCGLNQEPDILPCATGFYGDYYAADQSNRLRLDKRNQRAGTQSISDMLGIPVKVDCNEYYIELERIRKAAEGPIFGPDPSASGAGFCRLNKESFQVEIDDRNFGQGTEPRFVEPDGTRITNEGSLVVLCPPHIIADMTNSWLNANYQNNITTNVRGEVFPKVNDPSVAVGEIPAQISFSEIDEKCAGLALGQEFNMFDAGEISNFDLTTKAMAERMLRPSTFTVKGLANCCDFNYPGGPAAWSGSNGNCLDCRAYSASAIENPTTWVNVTQEVIDINIANGSTDGIGDKKIIGGYVLHVPSATRPETIFERGQRTSRVAKQMHGKGHSCIYGKLSFAPVRQLYAQNLQPGQFGYIPPERRTGLLDERLVNGKINKSADGNPQDVTFDTLVRFAGKVNITDIKDVHDERIAGLGLKFFGVGAAFNALNIEFNQLWLPFIPPFDQPEVARITFGDFNFVPQQEEGTIDLTHVAIGTGQVIGIEGGILNDTLFDPDKETGLPGNITGPPDNVFTASNNVDYYNGFILGGPPPLSADTLTDVFQNPLMYVYGTASPHRAGPAGSMKLAWARCPGEIQKIKNEYNDLRDAFKDGNFKTTNLRKTIEGLEDGDDFKMCGYMQFQEDPCKEPMENPDKRWLSDNIKIFELHLPKQSVPDYNMFCDNTVLAPFRMIREHSPQGFLQRVRNPIYVYAWQFRLILNNGAIRLPQPSITNPASNSALVTGVSFAGPPFFLGDELCPFGYDGFVNGERLTPDKEIWEQVGKVAVGERPKYYQGQPIHTLTSLVGTLEEVDAENLQPPGVNDISSGGPCMNDAQCKLKFGGESVCFNPGFANGDPDFSTGRCSPTNNAQFTLF